MQIHITEYKSTGTLQPALVGNMVRVFIDRDYHYGYFIDEHDLFSRLSEEQQAEYLATDGDVKFDVSEIQVQAIKNRARTYYA